MNILLWFFQVVVALFCISGAAWRFSNYAEASVQIPSVGALPYGVWNAIGLFEVVCALGLILPAALKLKPSLTFLAAACLTVEMLLITALHAHFFGFQAQATNPAMWSLALAAMSAFVAYGRAKLAPFERKGGR